MKKKIILAIGVIVLFIGMVFSPAGAGIETDLLKTSEDDDDIFAIMIVIGRINDFGEDEYKYSWHDIEVVYYWWSTDEGFNQGHSFDNLVEYEKEYYSLGGIVTKNFICAVMTYNGPPN